MGTELIFVDKTLGYALKHEKMSIEEFMPLKQKINDFSKMIFDISFDFLEDIKKLKDTDLSDVRICVRPGIERLKAVYDMGCTNVKVAVNRTAYEENPLPLKETLAEADRLKMKVSAGCIDLSAYSWEEIAFFQKLIAEYDIYSMIVHDCYSKLDTLTTYQRLYDLRQMIPCNVEFSGKNLLGLASGNTLGAIRSGACMVGVSVGGIGGFPAFEEVAMSVRHLLHIPLALPRNIAVGCKEILDCLGLDIPKTKPIIGSNIFAHESGIHVDGVIKRSDLYEPFAPEEVGLCRKIIIGKHSGRTAIEQKLKELNIILKPMCLFRVLEKVRRLAIEQKAAVMDEQLEELVREVKVCEGGYS